MPKQKRKAFTLQEKYDIIKKIQRGVKQSEICRDLGTSKSTIATMWKEKQKILESYEKESAKVKRIKKSAYDVVDRGLLKWFTQQRLQNVPISGRVLQEKASELGSMIQQSEFNCSRSWIERFKKRHNICAGKIVGESGAVNMDTVGDWLTDVWPKISAGFQSDDIFNADETGLFCKLTPDKTLKFVGEKCVGGKLSKDRITVLIAANKTGTEKRKLLVIGKSQNPRCFKNKILPINYRANNKAWMTSEIFVSELRNWDEELKRANRKILLFVDNCPAHPEVKNLQQIKLAFLPPNTSSMLQPMDQGVIHSLKSHYRRILLTKMIHAIDKGEIFTINLLDAINFVHLAWQRVSTETIAHCFNHAGFIRKGEEFESDDEIPLSEWLKKHNQDTVSMEDPLESQVKEIFNDFVFEEFVSVDVNTETTEFLTDDQIVASISSTNLEVSDAEDAEDNFSEEEVNVHVPSILEMMQNITDTRNFLQSRKVPENIWSSFTEVEAYINEIFISSKKKQTKITDFLK